MTREPGLPLLETELDLKFLFHYFPDKVFFKRFDDYLPQTSLYLLMKAFLLAKGAKQLYSSGKIVATGRKIKFDINMHFLLLGSFGFLLLFSFPCHRDGSIINNHIWNFATSSTRKRAFINFDLK